MNKIIFLITFAFTNLTFAETHREHKAHQHGAAKMAIAFDDVQGKITLELASEGLYGFEYVPKKEGDKKKQKDGLAKLEKNISHMISFSENLKCIFSKEKIEVNQQEGGKHSDIDAVFNIKCEKDPIDSELTFNIQKYFPKLKDVDVQILIGDVQKSVEANTSGYKVELKK